MSILSDKLLSLMQEQEATRIAIAKEEHNLDRIGASIRKLMDSISVDNLIAETNTVWPHGEWSPVRGPIAYKAFSGKPWGACPSTEAMGHSIKATAVAAFKIAVQLASKEKKTL